MSSEVFSMIVLAMEGFVGSLLTMLLLYRPARSFRLFSSRTSPKKHDEQIPLVGGIAIAIVIALSHIFLFDSLDRSFSAVLICSYVLMIIGIVDDRWEISSTLRFGLQTAIVLTATIVSGISIVNLGGVFSFSESLVLSPSIGLIFTAFCLVGVINATNMADGIDGLLGSLLTISVCAVILVSTTNGVNNIFVFSSILIGCLIAFLILNFGLFGKRLKLFLGDAGSTFLGFILGYFLIVLSQGESPTISTVSAGWIFGFPIIDSVSVIVSRLRAGSSPFKADRNHFHHKLIDTGFSPIHTVVIIVAIQIVIVFTGVSSNSIGVDSSIFFYLFVAITVVFHFYVDELCQLLWSIGKRSRVIRVVP